MSLSASPLGRPHLNTSSYQRSRNILGCIHSGACHLHHWYTHAGTDVCPMHTDPELCKENLQQSVSTPKKHFRYFLSCQKKKKNHSAHSSPIPSFNSVQFSRSVMSDSLWLHELQQARPPCPSPTPRVYSNSCPLSRWCHPAISSSAVPFSSCP